MLLAIPRAEVSNFALLACSLHEGDLWDAIHRWTVFDRHGLDRLAFGILAEKVHAFRWGLPDDWTNVANAREFYDGLSSRGLTLYSASAASSPSWITKIREELSSTQALLQTLECCAVYRASLEEDAIQARDAILAVLDRASSVKEQRAFVIVYEPREIETYDVI